ncbi:MAG: GNAT family N-acetyltransferase [Phormidium sp.]
MELKARTEIITDLKVRLARAEDKEAVLAICQQTWQHSSDFLPLGWNKWLADPNSRVFVVEIDSLPIGILGFVLMSEREAWYQGLRVAPHYRQQGLGLHLLLTLEQHIERFFVETNINILRYSTCSSNVFIDKYSKWQRRQKVGRYFPYKADSLNSPVKQLLHLDIDDFDEAWALVTSCNLFTRESYLYLNDPTKWQELTCEQLNNHLNEGRVWGLKQGNEIFALAIQMPVHTIDYLEGVNEALWKGAHQTLWLGYVNGVAEGLTTLLHELRLLAYREGYIAVGGFFPVGDQIFESLDIAGYQRAEELEYWVYEWQTQNVSDKSL